MSSRLGIKLATKSVEVTENLNGGEKPILSCEERGSLPFDLAPGGLIPQERPNMYSGKAQAGGRLILTDDECLNFASVIGK